MCGRFAQFSPKDILKAQFYVEEVACDVTPSYNIVPSNQILAIIRRERLKLGPLIWGLVPAWMHDKDKGKKPGIINARAETLSEKPAFRKALTRRRCLIPADGYYEWAREEGGKVPYYIYPSSKTPMGFAGLWESFRDADGKRHSTCAIITREAEGPLRDIHTRMPLVLTEEGRGHWLDVALTDKDRLTDILFRHSLTGLSFHRVSDQVNRASFNAPECMEPV